MLTAKGKYGLKALMHLSSVPPGKTVQAVDIAAANNIPKKFLDAILGELRNAGIVCSKRVLAAATFLRGRQMISRSATSFVRLTDLSPRSPARAVPHFASAMIARTSGPAQYGWR